MSVSSLNAIPLMAGTDVGSYNLNWHVTSVSTNDEADDAAGAVAKRSVKDMEYMGWKLAKWLVEGHSGPRAESVCLV